MSHLLPGLFTLIALVALAAAPAAAHESNDDALAHLDAALNAAPHDAALWLRRAGLQRARGDLASARAALARACALGLAPALAERERGLNARAEGRLAASEEHLQRARALAPRDVETVVAHATALAELGRARDAADALAQALELAPRADPEIHLARVRALAQAGELAQARRALDAAEAKLGPVPALAQEGIALDLRAGDVGAALARLDRAAAPARRRESWRVQRAEILERAGRPSEAAAEYAAALASLATLPPARRSAPASLTLASRARAGIERLGPAREARAQ